MKCKKSNKSWAQENTQALGWSVTTEHGRFIMSCPGCGKRVNLRTSDGGAHNPQQPKCFEIPRHNAQ